MLDTIRMYADGGARGNPGPAAGGAVLLELSDGQEGKVVAELGKYLGTATNNQAEYTGVIIGVAKARELGYNAIDIRLDSELAVKQLNGEYRVKNPELRILHNQVQEILEHFRSVNIGHVRREYNKRADAVVNECIDLRSDVVRVKSTK